MKFLSSMFFLTIVFISCSSKSYYCETGDTIPVTRNRNVCKHLNDSAVIYAIFVDADQYHPWSEFDINSTLDSIKKAAHWIENKAIESKEKLNINVINHVKRKKLSFSEGQARTLYSLDLTFNKRWRRRASRHHDYWLYRISKYAGLGIKQDRATNLATKNKINSMERLVAALRNKYKNDNVAVMIFVNGYYESEQSVSFNTSSNGPKTEYSIVTTKNPAVIAHEFLHLFGAVDLYPTLAYANFNFQDIKAKFPNEIMRIQHKEISRLMISPITQYYLGWKDTINQVNTRILFHKSDALEY